MARQIRVTKPVSKPVEPLLDLRSPSGKKRLPY